MYASFRSTMVIFWHNWFAGSWNAVIRIISASSDGIFISCHSLVTDITVSQTCQSSFHWSTCILLLTSYILASLSTPCLLCWFVVTYESHFISSSTEQVKLVLMFVCVSCIHHKWVLLYVFIYFVARPIWMKLVSVILGRWYGMKFSCLSCRLLRDDG